MKRKEKVGDVGVIVARFQVPWLHDVHKELIQDVLNEHEKVIIFLGLSQVRVTVNNPLDFEARKQMVLSEFPDVIVSYIRDCKEDDVWSKNLDNEINSLVGPTQTVTLYGGRDSFIKHYGGKHQTLELVSEHFISGTEIRRKISKKVKSSPDFRAGIIWAVNNQYPKVWATIDVAIFNDDYTKLLLGKKPDEKEYRFIGGFSDVKDESYEETVKREAQEETSVEIGDIQYIGSTKVDDWRYRSEVDKIATLFFQAKMLFGSVQPNDDIAELKWFDINTFSNGKNRDLLVSNHVVLMDKLLGEEAEPMKEENDE